MKKLNLLFLFLFSIIFFSGSVWAVSDQAVITKVAGEAFILRGGSSLTVREGMSCQADDVIKTGPDGTVDFSINGIAGTRVFPKTECVIGKTGLSLMQVGLKKGDTAFNIDKLPKDSTFKVETPTAVAAVRGTQLSGHYGEDGSRFTVRDGDVDVTNKETNETASVGEGETAEIPGDESQTNDKLIVSKADGADLMKIEDASTIKTCE